MKYFTKGKNLLLSSLVLLSTQASYAIIADGPEPKVVFEEDFSLVPAIEKYYGGIFLNDDTNCLHPEFFHTPGWKGLNIGYGKEAGEVYFSMSDDVYLQTPPLELSADGGKVTITFEYKRGSWDNQLTTIDNVYVQLRDRKNGMDTGITGIYNNPIKINTEWQEYSITLEGGTSDCSIRFWPGSYMGFLRNVKVKQVRPEIDAPVADAFSDFKGDSFTANWRSVAGADHYLLNVFTLDKDQRIYAIQDKEVADTHYTVTGLDSSKIYHYTVKAVGGSLTSGESNIIRCFGIPQPEILDFTNVGKEGFDISWKPALNAELYQLECYLEHTASSAGKYYLIDEDFLNTPGQEATPDNPVTGGANGLWLDDYCNRSNWYVKQPGFAADCITLNNILASMGMYGEIDGPTMDLSADGGKVTVEMRVRVLESGGPGSLGIYMLNSVPKVNEFTSDKIVDKIELWDEDSKYEGISTSWQNRTFTLKGGNEESYIAIQAYGYGALVQIDRLAVYQELQKGDKVRVPYRSIVTQDNENKINTNGEAFNADNDLFVCLVRGANTSGSTDGNVIYSEWSAPKSVVLPTTESSVGLAEAEAGIKVSVNNSCLNITNPTGEKVSIWNVGGVLILESESEFISQTGLTAGIYLVESKGKSVKVIVR